MRRCTRALWLVLLLALFISVLSPSVSAKTFDADFSRAGSQSTVSMDGAAVLEALGYSLGRTERSYLLSHAPVWLRYEDRISTAYVTTHFSDGVLTVYARPYSYLAENGQSVTWYPSEVALGERTLPLLLSAGEYTALFDGCAEEASLAVSVKYEAKLSLSSETVAALANLTYREAERIAEAYRTAYALYEEEKTVYEEGAAHYEAYLAELSEYRAASLLYEAYLEESALYEEALSAYQKYLSDLALYERENAAYQQYLLDLAAYNEKKAAYTAYLAEAEEYEASLAAYETYLASLERVRLQLSYMQIARIYVMDCCIYDGLLGPTVDSILNADDLLESNTVGADPYAVNLAKETSTNLKSILVEYFFCTTDEEKYNYYTLNYSNIVNNYVNLFRSLDDLYRTPMVRAGLITKGKAQKYVALLAELYAVCHLISDRPIANLDGTGYLDDAYTVQHWSSDLAGTYLSPAEILKDAVIPTLTGSVGTPIVGGYPTEVACPTPPAPVSDPTGEKPTVRYPVLPPEEKTEPTPPTPVPQPTPPTPVTQPTGDAPTPPTLTKEERDLRSAYLTGELVERVPREGSVSLLRAVSVNKSVFGGGTVTVLFRTSAGGDLLDKTTVDIGTEAVYNGNIPTRAEDAHAVYTFVGWQREDGQPVDLSACTEDMEVYPRFLVTPKYAVTFYHANGTPISVMTCREGEPIVYAGALPEKAATEAETYTFLAWQTEDCVPADLTVCRGEMHLYPAFSASPRLYTVTFLVGETPYSYQVPYGETPTCPEIPARRVGDLEELLFGFTPAIEPVSADAVYTAQLRSQPLFPMGEGYATVSEEGTRLCLDASVAGGTVLPLASLYTYFPTCRELCVCFPAVTLTFSYSVLLSLREQMPTKLSAVAEEGRLCYAFLNEQGGTIDEISVGALAKMSVATVGEKCRLSQNDGEKEYLNFTFGEDFVSFAAKSGCSYTYAEEYTVNAIANDGITFDFIDGSYFEGEWVAFFYRLREGQTLLSLSVTDTEGRAVALGEGGFYMPRGGVDIVALTRTRTFKILFVSDGITLKEISVAYGETPTPPPTPSKAADAFYLYTFVGWSSPVLPATEDAVYTAVYEEEALPQEEPSVFGGFLFRFFATVWQWIVDLALRFFGGAEPAALLPSGRVSATCEALLLLPAGTVPRL